MAEYINRQAFLDHMKGTSRYFAVKFDIESFPVADVAPVVHGRWEKEPSSFWRWTPSGAVVVARTTYRCGLCGRGTAVKSNYCPNCWAKMDIDDGGDNGAAD